MRGSSACFILISWGLSSETNMAVHSRRLCWSVKCVFLLFMLTLLQSHHCRAANTVITISNTLDVGSEIDLPHPVHSVNLSQSSPLFNRVAVTSDSKVIFVKSVSNLIGKIPFKYEPEDDDEEIEVTLNFIDPEKLSRFSENQYSGKVSENRAAGTVVEGLKDLKLFGFSNYNDIQYKLISSSDNGAFSVRKQYASPDSNHQLLQIVTNKVLDREKIGSYELLLVAENVYNVNNEKTSVLIEIEVLDVDDNWPVAQRLNYSFSVDFRSVKGVVGSVKAYDADGDILVYKMEERHPDFVVEPKSGKIILIHVLKPNERYKFVINAVEKKKKTMKSEDMHVTVRTYDREKLIVESSFYKQPNNPGASGSCSISNDSCTELVREKRAMRSTKTYEFKETHGNVRGKTVLTLDKKKSNEQFKLRDNNRWVVVDSNGEVRVNEPWDYEKLPAQKSIDFWVVITQPGSQGKF